MFIKKHEASFLICYLCTNDFYNKLLTILNTITWPFLF